MLQRKGKAANSLGCDHLSPLVVDCKAWKTRDSGEEVNTDALLREETQESSALVTGINFTSALPHNKYSQLRQREHKEPQSDHHENTLQKEQFATAHPHGLRVSIRPVDGGVNVRCRVGAEKKKRSMKMMH